MENPFKFGTIVEEEYFTDRVNEVAYIKQFLKSANHLYHCEPATDDIGVRHLINHFRVIPTVSSNPMTGSIDVSFQPDVDGTVLLEDVMTLIEKAHSEKDRMIVVLDEFQEISIMSYWGAKRA